MTVIAALKQGNSMFIGGDRMASEDSLALPMARPKVWSNGDYLFGFAGTLEGEHLQSKFSPPPVSGDLDTFMQDQMLSALDTFYEKWKVLRDQVDEKGMSLLICVGGLIYEHDPAFLTMTRYDYDYLSIGSGSNYAMGSLYSTEGATSGKARVKLAIESACEFSPTCGLPVDVLSMRVKHYK